MTVGASTVALSGNYAIPTSSTVNITGGGSSFAVSGDLTVGFAERERHVGEGWVNLLAEHGRAGRGVDRNDSFAVCLEVGGDG